MKRNKSTSRTRLVVALFVLLFISVFLYTLYFALPALTSTSYDSGKEISGAIANVAAEVASQIGMGSSTQPEIAHILPPEPVKALYMTSWVAGSKNIRTRLINLLDTTEANAVVIDIKDYTGKIAFKVNDPELQKMNTSENRISDIDELIKELHKKNIYVIGRIAVFQDPALVALRPELAVKRASDGAIWRDRKGISWLDAGEKDVWEYAVKIAEESYARGFDEINFDYIRFPSDGNMKDIAYPASEGKAKAAVLDSFFAYVASKLRPQRIPISIDVFGMTAVNVDDLGIGQILESALAHFDYVAPMVYPSHFPATWNGLKNPAEHPYEVIKISMTNAVKRAEATSTLVWLPGSQKIASTSPARYVHEPVSRLKLRPWLQDFNLGATYTAEKVRAQIQATYDAGLTSWMMWDPNNRYTAEALLHSSE